MSQAEHGKHNPLAQFEVKKIIDLELAGIDISFTNSSLYMVLATITIISFMIFSTRKKLLIPSKLQVIAEMTYGFLENMIDSTIGKKEGKKFFPLIFSLFSFIFVCNVLGLTPYSFTATSQIVITAALALISFFTLIIYGIYKKGLIGFFKMFIPSGLPTILAPLLFIIEFFSFLIRPVTLSVRLFANMVAGHVLLKVFAGFILALGAAFGTLPFTFSVVMTGFELFVAGLQAYIFTILVCVYLSEIDMH
ncbi:MAG: F0F1 ATP synthase subunit A [Rickettsiales bacterium]|nr:F0F1 ATP synthase subunit A [Rickettsiales bacterium]